MTNEPGTDTPQHSPDTDTESVARGSDIPAEPARAWGESGNEQEKDDLEREIEEEIDREFAHELWLPSPPRNPEDGQRKRREYERRYNEPWYPHCGTTYSMRDKRRRELIERRRAERGAGAREPPSREPPSRELRLDWYLDAALREVRGAMRLAGEGKLRQEDLWGLLTFGQHMYAGMRDAYGIELNSALLERERGSLGGAAVPPATAAGTSAGPQWPAPAPRRCPTCLRAVAMDAESLGPSAQGNHPRNRSSFSRLFPHEGRPDAGGLYGLARAGSRVPSRVPSNPFSTTPVPRIPLAEYPDWTTICRPLEPRPWM